MANAILPNTSPVQKTASSRCLKKEKLVVRSCHSCSLSFPPPSFVLFCPDRGRGPAVERHSGSWQLRQTPAFPNSLYLVVGWAGLG